MYLRIYLQTSQQMCQGITGVSKGILILIFNVVPIQSSEEMTVIQTCCTF